MIAANRRANHQRRRPACQRISVIGNTASCMSAGTTATRHACLAAVPEGSAALYPASAVHAALQFLKDNDPEEYRRRLDMLLPQ